jgi:hypothetical protein
MALLHIREVEALDGFRLKLTLTDDSVIERDVGTLLMGPVFEPVRNDKEIFEKARVESGTVVWPNGADLCPDILIWSGPPPDSNNRHCIHHRRNPVTTMQATTAPADWSGKVSQTHHCLQVTARACRTAQECSGRR